MFRSRAGVDMTTVAYKGGPAAMNDVIGGRITAVFTNPVNATFGDATAKGTIKNDD